MPHYLTTLLWVIRIHDYFQHFANMHSATEASGSVLSAICVLLITYPQTYLIPWKNGGRDDQNRRGVFKSKKRVQDDILASEILFPPHDSEFLHQWA